MERYIVSYLVIHSKKSIFSNSVLRIVTVCNIHSIQMYRSILIVIGSQFWQVNFFLSEKQKNDHNELEEEYIAKSNIDVQKMRGLARHALFNASRAFELHVNDRSSDGAL